MEKLIFKFQFEIKYSQQVAKALTVLFSRKLLLIATTVTRLENSLAKL